MGQLRTANKRHKRAIAARQAKTVSAGKAQEPRTPETAKA